MAGNDTTSAVDTATLDTKVQAVIVGAKAAEDAYVGHLSAAADLTTAEQKEADASRAADATRMALNGAIDDLEAFKGNGYQLPPPPAGGDNSGNGSSGSGGAATTGADSSRSSPSPDGAGVSPAAVAAASTN